jgi:hypothetical protein
MSFNSMLAHRCSLIDSVETSTDGSSVYTWQTVATNVPCFLYLNFIRRGKDSLWVEAAGRPKDRTGVIFFKGGATVRSGMRIEMTKGPNGMFSIEGALDEAWTPRRRHHLEFGVIEVAAIIKRPERVGDPHT